MKYCHLFPVLVVLCASCKTAPEKGHLVKIEGGIAVPVDSGLGREIQDGISLIFGGNCGGLVVADRWILTAGHCVIQAFERVSEQIVYRPEFIGNGRVSHFVGTGERPRILPQFTVVRTVVHPSYLHAVVQHRSVNPPLESSFDLAMIEIRNSRFESVHKSISLYSRIGRPALTVGDEILIGGRGCQSRLHFDTRRITQLTEKYIKTVRRTESSDICTGDSGSPAYASYRGYSLPIGINVSRTVSVFSLARLDLPEVISWIQSVRNQD